MQSGDAGREVRFAVVDSRLAGPSAIFFALRGERGDGHAFVEAAAAAGAAGAVVSRIPNDAKALDPRFGVIHVTDTLAALGALAAVHRQALNLPVVGVTGSAGKTTTKDMIASVLSSRRRVASTAGNQNNEIGVPLTVLGMGSEHDCAVVEMAMRGRGQIASLAQIVRPTMGVITNVGDAHIELLGSRENTAVAKAELIEALEPGGAAILNGDDPLTSAMGASAKAGVRVILYGLGDHCLIRPDAVDLQSGSSSFTLGASGMAERAIRFTVPLPGMHNVVNALAALAVGIEFGMDAEAMAAGLASFAPSSMRMQFQPAPAGYVVIDDSYNANPASMECAIDAAVVHAAGRRVIAVMGEMLELGQASACAHARVGRHAARAGVAGIVAVGAHASDLARAAREEGLRNDMVLECGDNAAAAAAATVLAREGDVVLVKGSRGMHMEEIVASLVQGEDGQGELA